MGALTVSLNGRELFTYMETPTTSIAVLTIVVEDAARQFSERYTSVDHLISNVMQDVVCGNVADLNAPKVWLERCCVVYRILHETSPDDHGQIADLLPVSDFTVNIVGDPIGYHLDVVMGNVSRH
jgi:hypothetical protein